MPCKMISAETVRKLLTMKDVVEACETAFEGWGKGEVICPAKITLELGETTDWPPYKNGLNAMPAYIHSQKSAGIKCVTGSLNNMGKGLPFIIALILLFDPETGIFRCVVDGAQITNYRTGAQAAVAAKHICDKKKVNLGLYGAGVQGRTQLMAFAEVFDLGRVTVYDLAPEATQKYLDEMSKTVKAELTAASEPRAVTEGADIVISVTHGRDKFIKNDWISPGQIVFPMGSFTECEDELLVSADRLFVDSPEQCMHRGALAGVAAQGKLSEADVTATIGELVCGAKDGRIRPGERVVCVPIGTGAMDVAVATRVYEKALASGDYQDFVFNQDLEIVSYE